MNKVEAMNAVDAWIKKGWRFTIDGRPTGWTCDIIGAGLAHASCGGASSEAAIELALKHATAMEDDPNIVLGRYESRLKELCIRVYGEKAFKGFKIIEMDWELGPKRIQYTIRPDWDHNVQIEKERQFWGLTAHLPKEIQTPLLIEVEWPEETAGPQGAIGPSGPSDTTPKEASK